MWTSGRPLPLNIRNHQHQHVNSRSWPSPLNKDLTLLFFLSYPHRYVFHVAAFVISEHLYHFVVGSWIPDLVLGSTPAQPHSHLCAQRLVTLEPLARAAISNEDCPPTAASAGTAISSQKQNSGTNVTSSSESSARFSAASKIESLLQSNRRCVCEGCLNMFTGLQELTGKNKFGVHKPYHWSPDQQLVQKAIDLLRSLNLKELNEVLKEDATERRLRTKYGSAVCTLFAFCCSLSSSV